MDRPENAERLAAFGKAGVGGVSAADPGKVADVGGFIGADGHNIGGTPMHEVGDIEGKGGAAAGVVAGGPAVHPDGGVGANALEVQKHAAAALGGVHTKGTAIPGAAMEVAVQETMHAAVIIPVVGDGHGLPGVVIEGGRGETGVLIRVGLDRDGAPVVIQQGVVTGIGGGVDASGGAE